MLRVSPVLLGRLAALARLVTPALQVPSLTRDHLNMNECFPFLQCTIPITKRAAVKTTECCNGSAGFTGPTGRTGYTGATGFTGSTGDYEQASTPAVSAFQQSEWGVCLQDVYILFFISMRKGGTRDKRTGC